MMQANLLLTTAGRPPNTYVIFDLMRFPLGILTGVGFIGAGAIYQAGQSVAWRNDCGDAVVCHGDQICIGGGRIGLGISGTAIGIAVLWSLKALEDHLSQDKTALLTVVAKPSGPDAAALRMLLQNAGLRIMDFKETFDNESDPHHTMTCHVRWRGLPHDTAVPAMVTGLAKADGVARLQWNL